MKTLNILFHQRLWPWTLTLVFSFFAGFVPLVAEAQAGGMTELSYTGQSESKDPHRVRQEVTKKAIEEVSVRLIKDMIGEERFKENRELIETGIISHSDRYIMLVRPGRIVGTPQGSQMAVEIGLSRGNLEALLLERGLLYRMDSPPVVLPMIQVTDRVSSRAFHWWAQEPSTDRSLNVNLLRQVHAVLKSQFQSSSFYVLDPLAGNLKKMTPEVYQGNESPPTEDYLLMGRFHGAQVVLRGELLVSQVRDRSETYRIDLSLRAQHTANGRVVGEVIRSYDTDQGAYQQVVSRKLSEIFERVAGDLASQIGDAWRSGTFGSNLLQLAVVGNLSYQEMTRFRQILSEEVREIKTLKDRSFEPGRVTFEVDTASEPDQLAKILKGKNFPQFRVEVGDTSVNTLELSVRAL